MMPAVFDSSHVDQLQIATTRRVYFAFVNRPGVHNLYPPYDELQLENTIPTLSRDNQDLSTTILIGAQCALHAL